jgi:hypothetical protein
VAPRILKQLQPAVDELMMTQPFSHARTEGVKGTNGGGEERRGMGGGGEGKRKLS